MFFAVLTCALGTHKELICELHQVCSNGNEGVDKYKLNVWLLSSNFILFILSSVCATHSQLLIQLPSRKSEIQYKMYRHVNVSLGSMRCYKIQSTGTYEFIALWTCISTYVLKVETLLCCGDRISPRIWTCFLEDICYCIIIIYTEHLSWRHQAWRRGWILTPTHSSVLNSDAYDGKSN